MVTNVEGMLSLGMCLNMILWSALFNTHVKSAYIMYMTLL
jgi:hypothetical protein